MLLRSSGEEPLGSHRRVVPGLWVAAVATLGASAIGLASSAWADPPANDGLIPTSNDLGVECAAGIYANEVCQTDNSTSVSTPATS